MAVWLVPILLGALAFWGSNKTRGRNAQKALRYFGVGSWLLPLSYVAWGALLPIPFGTIVFLLFLFRIPSVLLFLAAANCMLKEMRAQQKSEYTDPAV